MQTAYLIAMRKLFHTAEGLTNGDYAVFTISSSTDKMVPSDVKAHFIILADVKTTATTGKAGQFTTLIENPESFNISDAGNATVEGNKLDFATYEFEPPEGFIFTRGMNDPQVPSYSQMNQENPMLQIRTKSMLGGDSIQSIGVKTTIGSVRFGQGIKSIALLVDNDSDGKLSPTDTVIEKVTKFESETLLTFRNLENYLTYTEGQEKHLLFVCDFNMDDGEKAQIQIGNGKVKLNTDKDPTGLPVTSKVFLYEYDPNDPNNEPKKDDGCSITVID